ncbi:hypothetical protein ABIC28_002726 [Rhodococcus sp. PvR044]|jgi:hypothetical protein|uniref:hypothetical protein n=1 Tax=Rhodococcus TaxID=1827 RepID=UPI000BD53688|nr:MULTISPECIES: hypothetical protein [Rhodococcus]MBP1162038.1 hypothetical protein [Rhodococcus sp. PvR099]MCZ4557794.1 hypothetical protein [Rhodococcus maanshanensis]PTR43252.1 hypothetical protein C8K38_108123 [Rhodococcus sp. OK611]SNX91115.1 hypothetical protein SAMN05447004_108121 [Rhodococcus sp. OK270]
MAGGFPVFRLFTAAFGSAVLVRFRMPDFSTANADSEDHAYDQADRITRDLLDALPSGCGPFTFIGALEGYPVGDILVDDTVPSTELWWAPTRYGSTWLVLGTAVDESSFWRLVNDDDDLNTLGAHGPATRQRVTVIGTLTQTN